MAASPANSVDHDAIAPGPLKLSPGFVQLDDEAAMHSAPRPRTTPFVPLRIAPRSTPTVDQIVRIADEAASIGAIERMRKAAEAVEVPGRERGA